MFIQTAGAKVNFRRKGLLFTKMKVSNFYLKWHKIEETPEDNKSPHVGYFEYFIDEDSLPKLLDKAYGYKNFVHNNFHGFIIPTSNIIYDKFLKTLFLGEIKDVIDLEKIFEGKIPKFIDLTYFTNSQVPIYTCVCGDIHCGRIVITIEKFENLIKWDFGIGEKIGPFYFEKNQYLEQLNNTLENK